MVKVRAIVPDVTGFHGKDILEDTFNLEDGGFFTGDILMVLDSCFGNPVPNRFELEVKDLLRDTHPHFKCVREFRFGGARFLWWIEREPAFRIIIIQDDGSPRDSGEGPWDTWEQADAFARAEVGMKYTIEGGSDGP